MKLKLMNYLGEFTKEVDVVEGSNVTINIISGDWVLIKPFYQDSSNDRRVNFYDGSVSFIATKEIIDRINSMERNYDLFDLRLE